MFRRSDVFCPYSIILYSSLFYSCFIQRICYVGLKSLLLSRFRDHPRKWNENMIHSLNIYWIALEPFDCFIPRKPTNLRSACAHLAVLDLYIASIMRKMGREVLCSNLGPDKKSVRTKINSWPILWKVGSGSFFSIFSSSFRSRYVKNGSGGPGFESRPWQKKCQNTISSHRNSMGGQLSVNVRIPIRLGSRLLNDVTDRQTNIIVFAPTFRWWGPIC